MWYRQIFTGLLLSLISNNLISGVKWPESNYYFKVKSHYGYLLPHHTALEYLTTEHISGFDLNVAFNRNYNNVWDSIYHYPLTGIGYYYSNLGNPDVFGNVNAIYTYLNVPFLRPNKKIHLNYQIGFGISHVSRIFEINGNYRNVAMSSHLNIFIQFTGCLDFEINNKITLSAETNFTHISNGKMSSPNLGLNLVTGSIGAKYKFIHKEIPTKFTTLPDIKPWNFLVVYSGGIKSANQYKKNPMYISSLQIHSSYRLSMKRSFGIGLDLFYDPTRKDTFDDLHDIEKFDRELFMPAVFAFQEVYYNRISMVMGLGYYIGVKNIEYSGLYSRIGLRYYFNQHLFTNLTLKSHYAIADFIEWGVGYQF